MPSCFGSKPFRLSGLDSCNSLGGVLRQGDPDSEKMVFDRGDLCRCVPDVSAVVGDICNVCIYSSQTTDPAVEVAEIQAPVSVPVVGAVDEEVRGTLDEMNRVLRLYVSVVVLGKNGPDEIS